MKTRITRTSLAVLFLVISLACNAITPAGAPATSQATQGMPPLEATNPSQGEAPVVEVTPQVDNPTQTTQGETPLASTPPAASPTAGSEAQPPEPTPEPPDVLHIAYVANGNLYLWTENGDVTQLTASGDIIDVKLSPDGQQAAFVRNVDPFHAELWAIAIDGSNERQLVSAAAFDAINPPENAANQLSLAPYQWEWAPGGGVLWFNTRQSGEGMGLEQLNDLRQVDAASGELLTLLGPGTAGNFYFSPDGSQIALVQPDTISLINADGSNPRADVLVYEPVITYSEYRYYATPIWSPDSTSLQVIIPPADPMAQPVQPTTLWRIPIDGSAAVQVAQLEAAPFFAGEARLSPDLNRVVYLRDVGDPVQNAREMHLYKTATAEDVVYVTEPLIELFNWSPDNTHFAFAARDTRELFIGDAAGSPPVSLGLPNVFNLAWVDGSRVMHLLENAGSIELRLTNTAGTSTVIASGLTFPVYADWVVW